MSLEQPSWGRHFMATSATVHFTCPNCSALYHVVKAEPGPETTNNPEVACHICSAPLQHSFRSATEGLVHQ